MTNVLIVGLCFAVGVLMRRAGQLTEAGVRGLNVVIINLALPAAVFNQIHAIHFRPEVIGAILTPWVAFAANFTILLQAARLLKLSRPAAGSLILTSSLSNGMFVGLPMVEAFYGAGHLGLAVMVDQLGTSLVRTSLGIPVAVRFASSGKVNPRAMTTRALRFPAFIALCLALLIGPVTLPASVGEILGRLAGLLTPLALLSVGAQLRLDAVRELAAPLAVGLTMKLIAMPSLVWLFLRIFCFDQQESNVVVFQSALGPQIGIAAIAMEFGLDVRVATLMIGIGTPLSMLTAAGWWWVLAL